MEMDRKDPAIKWLLSSRDPSVRYFTLVDLLDESESSKVVRLARRRIPFGARYTTLLSGQVNRDSSRKRGSHGGLWVKFSGQSGGFGVHPYQKWTGAHWRLVSLVELGMQKGDRHGIAAAEQVLRWLCSENHHKYIRKISGLTRRCASQEGNALGVCSRLGLADDQRVQGLVHSLVEWQWPDGGWNCDPRPEAHHSSFNESLSTMWGLIEYHRATGDQTSLEAAHRTAEFLLRHRLFRSEKTGKVIRSDWLKLHYPLYWHYDILQSLRILSLIGKTSDPRAQEALDILESKRDRDGLWRVGGRHWAHPGRKVSNVEAVDWGRKGPNEMITLNALRVLRSADRVSQG
jgi:hypothetical protein